MTYDEFNAFCKSLPATTHVVQWGNSDVWKVGGKVFAIGGLEKSGKPAFTFKTSEQNFYYLSEYPGYRPAPYLASRGLKWIQQYDASPSEDDDLMYYIKESHRIVSSGLSKKNKKNFGLMKIYKFNEFEPFIWKRQCFYFVFLVLLQATVLAFRHGWQYLSQI